MKLLFHLIAVQLIAAEKYILVKIDGYANLRLSSAEESTTDDILDERFEPGENFMPILGPTERSVNDESLDEDNDVVRRGGGNDGEAVLNPIRRIKPSDVDYIGDPFHWIQPSQSLHHPH